MGLPISSGTFEATAWGGTLDQSGSIRDNVTPVEAFAVPAFGLILPMSVSQKGGVK